LPDPIVVLGKVAERLDDDRVMRLLKLILKANGKRGVPQGGVISPLLSNIYLTEVDKMLERAKEVTRCGKYTYLEYARFADDLVILVDGFRKWGWLGRAAYKRLLEELHKLEVQINPAKTRLVDLARGETFSFLAFDFRRAKTRRGKWGVRFTPRQKARTALLRAILGTWLTRLTEHFVFCARFGRWRKSKRPTVSQFPLKATPAPGPV